MSIQIKLVTNKKELKAFVELPWSIYKNDPYWVPPLKMAVYDLLDIKHPVYETSEISLWTALKDGEVVGRIAAIDNQRSNEFHGERCCFWGFLEAIDDSEVFKKLFETVETYAAGRELNILRGPVNPSTNYECGLLTDGMHDSPQIMMTYNPQYYVDKVEKDLGFKRVKNLYAYEFDNSSVLPEKVTRVAQRIASRNSVSWRKVNKKNWDQEVKHMYDIYNDAWEKNWGFVPMTEAEFKHTAKDLKSVVDEDLVLFCEVDNEPVGFIVALPDFNQVLKKVKDGQLFPTGIFKILFNQKKIDRYRVITLGLKKEYQVKGLSTILYVHLKQHLEDQKRFKTGEFSWILEDNDLMNKPLLLMGAKVYKNYAIYEKDLS